MKGSEKALPKYPYSAILVESCLPFLVDHRSQAAAKSITMFGGFPPYFSYIVVRKRYPEYY